MKKTHIVGLVVVCVLLGGIFTSLMDSSSYADFEEAFGNPGDEYHVVGTLDRSAQIVYNPSENPNLTRFTMLDEHGVKRVVHLAKSKPQDFERSESVVVIGEAQGDVFHAKEILMKCPSKYQEQNKFQTGQLQ